MILAGGTLGASSIPISGALRPAFAENLPMGTMGASSAPKPLNQGDDPPGPANAIEVGWKTKQFARVGFTSPGEFLGKRKRKNGRWRKLAFSSTHFSFSTVRFAHRRPAHGAGRPGTVVNIIVTSCDSCIYGDKVAFFGSFLGYKKEHPRYRSFLQPAAFTTTKLPFLILFWAIKENAPPLSQPAHFPLHKCEHMCYNCPRTTDWEDLYARFHHYKRRA